MKKADVRAYIEYVRGFARRTDVTDYGDMLEREIAMLERRIADPRFESKREKYEADLETKRALLATHQEMEG